MRRAFLSFCFIAAAFCQTADTPAKFDLADVHASAKSGSTYMSGGVLRGNRYDLRNATMVDLIRLAYTIDDSRKVVGGPGWIDMDRFDIAAKAPAGTPPETLKLMLQDLLADRFKLVLHKDSKPLPMFVLSLGKGKPKMKESDGSGEPGCQGQPQNPAPGEVAYQVVFCRNMTMEQFAQQRMAGNYVSDPVVDQTGLKGAWDFEIKWTGRAQLTAAGSAGITYFDAIDKQLGLKLEPQKVSVPVIAVDSVNEKPTDNPPGVTSNLPPPPPGEFEVASIRPSKPDEQQNGRIQNGRPDLQNFPLKFLINFAWDINSDDMLVGAPKFLDTAKFDVTAKASTEQIDDEDLRVMVRALLADRFKLKTHMEERVVNAYVLTSVKPKLKKADPSNRSACANGPGPDGKDPRDAAPINARLVTCLNTTMAQLAGAFQNFAGGYIQASVLNETKIDGAYDFTLNFAGAGIFRNGGAGGRGGDLPGAAAGGAADPSGAISLFDAVNKQLGLKLEQQKRPMQVLVIDHVEETPTDN